MSISANHHLSEPFTLYLMKSSSLVVFELGTHILSTIAITVSQEGLEQRFPVGGLEQEVNAGFMRMCLGGRAHPQRSIFFLQDECSRASKDLSWMRSPAAFAISCQMFGFATLISNHLRRHDKYRLFFQLLAIAYTLGSEFLRESNGLPRHQLLTTALVWNTTLASVLSNLSHWALRLAGYQRFADGEKRWREFSSDTGTEDCILPVHHIAPGERKEIAFRNPELKKDCLSKQLPIRWNWNGLGRFLESVQAMIAPYIALGGPEMKEGYLIKRANSHGRWKASPAMFFVLIDPLMRYYTCRGGTLLGTINLHNAGIWRPDPQEELEFSTGINKFNNPCPHVFAIMEPEHDPHMLCATSDVERDKWVEALMRCQGILRAKTSYAYPTRVRDQRERQ